jgi:putative transposase
VPETPAFTAGRRHAFLCYNAVVLLTYRYRIKGKPGAVLGPQAREVNRVWNFCGDTQEAARRHNKRWPSGYDLINLTHGSSRELGLHSDTVQAVCKEFATRRSKIRKRPRWRGKKALGWIPFQAGRAIKIDGDTAIFLGRRYRLWLSRPIGGTIKCGCFAADREGRWYLNLQCEVEGVADCGRAEIGIDLGLATLATASSGEKIPNLRIVRKRAAMLARAQRAGRKKQARRIHAKTERRRKHYLHEISTRLVRENSLIAVGNVSAAKLVRTRMAKSVLDASWSTLRHQLRYKAIAHGAVYVEVDERWSSQLCSTCGSLPASRPRGIAQLGVRSWACCDCGTVHDRDHNAALNILASGRSIALHLTENPRPSGRGRC